MISTAFLLTALVVALIPGSGVLYTVSTGLFIGRKASVFAAIGCTVGIVPPLLASVFGLAALFHASAVAFQVVKYAGAAYLLYLAWQMWRNSSPLAVRQEQQSTHYTGIAYKGFLINILNPKLSIFFLAFLPQFIPADATSAVTNMLVLGAVFMLMTLVVFIAYGLLASRFSEFVVSSEKVSLWMQKIFAGSFAALGLKLALSERS